MIGPNSGFAYLLKIACHPHQEQTGWLSKNCLLCAHRGQHPQLFKISQNFSQILLLGSVPTLVLELARGSVRGSTLGYSCHGGCEANGQEESTAAWQKR